MHKLKFPSFLIPFSLLKGQAKGDYNKCVLASDSPFTPFSILKGERRGIHIREGGLINEHTMEYFEK